MKMFESLIAEFSEKTGQELAPAADGSVSIEADGVLITVQGREERGDAVMFAFPAGDMKPEPATMARALELGAHGAGTDGFYLGIAGGEFVLSGVLPLEGASAEDFATRLLALAAASAKVASAMARALAEYAGGGAEETSGGACNLSMLQV